MDSSAEEYDSDQEPEYLSSEGEMDFLDQQPRVSAEAKAKSAVWGVIDKSVLAHVQVTHVACVAHFVAPMYVQRACAIQDESLAAVQGILGCSRDTARKLLTHFQWDKEALFGTALQLHPALLLTLVSHH